MSPFERAQRGPCDKEERNRVAGALRWTKQQARGDSESIVTTMMEEHEFYFS